MKITLESGHVIVYVPSLLDIWGGMFSLGFNEVIDYEEMILPL
jgi:hypothetical protein